MKFTLTTLSPIHIGNGEQISNWSYAINNGKISIYNFEKVVKALKNDTKKLLNLTATIERNPLSKNLGDILKDYKLNINSEYTVDFKGKIQKQRRDALEYKQIWEFIKENGKVYIPGTEIKGAIRTALFYKILKDKFQEDEKIKNQFLKEYRNCLNVKDFKDENDKKRKVQNKFSNLEKRWESIVFRAGFDKVFDKDFKADAKKDILKILLISDSDLKNPNDVLNIKDITALGVSKHFDELHELLKSGSNFIVDLRIPFNEEYKKIFPNTYKYLGMKKLREACSEFAIAMIEADIEYFQKTDELKPDEKSKILEKLEKRRNLAKISPEKKYIILRLGKHQGFLSTTINLLVKEFSPELYAQAYKYLVHRGYSDFPNKSRKLTLDNELLGWCVLTPEDSQ
jgi:CRISPR-associated protein Csm5